MQATDWTSTTHLHASAYVINLHALLKEMATFYTLPVLNTDLMV